MVMDEYPQKALEQNKKAIDLERSEVHFVDQDLLDLHGFGYQSDMRESFKKLIKRHPVLTR